MNILWKDLYRDVAESLQHIQIVRSKEIRFWRKRRGTAVDRQES